VLKNVNINSQELSLTNSDYFTVIDSGTTISYFPRNLYSDVERQINNFCAQINRCLGDSFITENGMCFKLKDNINYLQFVESMPSIFFKFEGDVNYEWKPRNYLYNYTDADFSSNDYRETYCLGFAGWHSNEILLGSTWMHNHDIIFDLANKRIGLVESYCDNVNGGLLDYYDSLINNYGKSSNFNSSSGGVISNSTVVNNNSNLNNSNLSNSFLNTNSSQSQNLSIIPKDYLACNATVDTYKKLIIVISILAVIFILILVIALNKFRRGQNFLWMRIANEDIGNFFRIVNLY